MRIAIDAGNLPLAVAAIGDLRALGVDVERAPRGASRPPSAWARRACKRRPRRRRRCPHFEDFQPLSSFLTGPALTSKATQILHAATRGYAEAAGTELPLVAPLPLFSALPKDALRDLVGAFEMITVPAG